MELVRNFKKLDKGDVDLAGGKGASLGEMTQAKIPVPPGFVLLAGAFDRFLEETDIDVEIDAVIDKVKHEDINSVEKASEKIRAIINNVEMPADIAKEIKKEFKKLDAKYVAVRSSATAEDSADASWAGELESYLNTTDKDLLAKVKKCWSSLFTPRAIFYRFEKKLHTSKVSVAVVVQKMIQSKVSGITFTVHPVTEDKNQMIIEAGWGLGEAIVSGMVTPDAYVIDKEDFSIIDINVADQAKQIIKTPQGTDFVAVEHNKREEQKLSGTQIVELAKICANIEKHYNFPCDIEWAWEKKKFYIVQSRPITTLMN
jgi:pyruvate, water dikinase